MQTRQLVEQYEMEWVRRCYFDGIPDEVPRVIDNEHLAPSWKRIAIALLRNDMAMESLGNMRKQSKWYGVFKRIELNKDTWVQLYLF